LRFYPAGGTSTVRERPYGVQNATECINIPGRRIGYIFWGTINAAVALAN
jgi:hypothetical protein